MSVLLITSPPPPDLPQVIRAGPGFSPRGQRRAAARGLYRIFAPAGYRFYRSNTAPPLETDSPFASSATLPYQPATTFADGTWFLSASYFNGVLDSGFLPLGPAGETYLTIIIASGAAAPAAPSPPITATLQQAAGGAVRIAAVYSALADAAGRATQWAIAYTTNGTTPVTGAPTLTPIMQTGPLSILSIVLPSQTPGTIVKVQLQTRRPNGAGWIYSAAGEVLSITVAGGPSSPIAITSWAGSPPDGED